MYRSRLNNIQSRVKTLSLDDLEAIVGLGDKYESFTNEQLAGTLESMKEESTRLNEVADYERDSRNFETLLGSDGWWAKREKVKEDAPAIEETGRYVRTG